jgi:hypothetical protein
MLRQGGNVYAPNQALDDEDTVVFKIDARRGRRITDCNTFLVPPERL